MWLIDAVGGLLQTSNFYRRELVLQKKISTKENFEYPLSGLFFVSLSKQIVTYSRTSLRAISINDYSISTPYAADPMILMAVYDEITNMTLDVRALNGYLLLLLMRMYENKPTLALDEMNQIEILFLEIWWFMTLEC